jgi:hypothetical protein
MLELAPKVYRVMSPDDTGQPVVGRSARALGVRVGTPGAGGPDEVDIAIQPDGTVKSGAGGMSVAPRWQDLPRHRIPKRLNPRLDVPKARGKDEDICWRVGTGAFVSNAFGPSLWLDVDGPKHGTIQPDRTTTLADYEAAVSATRGEWVNGED